MFVMTPQKHIENRQRHVHFHAPEEKVGPLTRLSLITVDNSADIVVI